MQIFMAGEPRRDKFSHAVRAQERVLGRIKVCWVVLIYLFQAGDKIWFGSLKKLAHGS